MIFFSRRSRCPVHMEEIKLCYQLFEFIWNSSPRFWANRVALYSHLSEVKYVWIILKVFPSFFLKRSKVSFQSRIQSARGSWSCWQLQFCANCGQNNIKVTTKPNVQFVGTTYKAEKKNYFFCLIKIAEVLSFFYLGTTASQIPAS